MRLHELKNVPGAVKRRKRVGCGEGNGRGKTCGRGGKGQTARSGGSIRPGFEGGQMPLYRKLPHRGFNNHNFRTEYNVVNLSVLENLSEMSEFDADVFAKNGIAIRKGRPLKVLGNGEITRAVTVKADRFSTSAKKKIEEAGGKVIEL
ncbi:MAG: 50S ribosomal protein L15 [Opitutales bacterium]|nr:50S ribosomal protein L15 [Opitutales bacterium]